MAGRHRKCAVAIVGGGATAVLLAAALGRAGADFVLLEPGDRLGAGLAYRTTVPTHVLNTRASRMSAHAEDPKHFARWAGCSGDDFASRAQYGGYLSAVADAVVPEGAVVQARAIGIRSAGAGAAILCDNGTTVTARRVALALGHGPMVSPLPQLATVPNYHNDPWQLSAATIDPEAAVLIIGTGLTAVDAVLSLDAGGHRGPITVLSRSGQLPQVHSSPGAPLPVAVSSTSLPQLIRQVRVALATSPDWRRSVDGLRPYVDGLWRGLSDADQLRFVRHVSRWWELHRHRMAPSIGATMAAYRATGRLQQMRGQVRDVTPNGSQLAVNTTAGEFTAAHIVNCTGARPLVTDPGSLASVLIHSGIARIDPLGFGLCVTTVGALPDTDDTLFAFGPLRRGRLHWETTAIPEIRAQAAAFAADC